MVAENTSVKAIVDSILKCLECPICLDLLDDPVATGCNHTFCRNCIHTALKKSYAIACPLCKCKVTKRQLQKKIQLSEIVKVAKRLAETVEQDLLEKTISQVCSYSINTPSSESCSNHDTSTSTAKRKRQGQQTSEAQRTKAAKIVENDANNKRMQIKGIMVHPDAELQRKAKISTNLNIQNGFPARQRKGKTNSSNIIDKYLVRKCDGIEEKIMNDMQQNEDSSYKSKSENNSKNNLPDKDMKNLKHPQHRGGIDTRQCKNQATVAAKRVPKAGLNESCTKGACERITERTLFEGKTDSTVKNKENKIRSTRTCNDKASTFISDKETPAANDVTKKRNCGAISGEISNITEGEIHKAKEKNVERNFIASSNDIFDITDTYKEIPTAKKERANRNTRSSKGINDTIESDKVIPSARKNNQKENPCITNDSSHSDSSESSTAFDMTTKITAAYSNKEPEHPTGFTLDPYEFIPSQSEPKVIKKKQSKREVVKRSVRPNLRMITSKTKSPSVVPGVEVFASSSEDFVYTVRKQPKASTMTKKSIEEAVENYHSDHEYQNDQLFVTPALNAAELSTKTAFAQQNSCDSHKMYSESSNIKNYITKCRRSKRIRERPNEDLSKQKEISNWFDEIESVESHALSIDCVKEKHPSKVPKLAETSMSNAEISEESDDEVNKNERLIIAEDCFDDSVLSDGSEDTVYNDFDKNNENNVEGNQNNAEASKFCHSPQSLLASNENGNNGTYKQNVVLESSMPKLQNIQSLPKLDVGENNTVVQKCDESCAKVKNIPSGNETVENSMQNISNCASTYSVQVCDELGLNSNSVSASNEKSENSTQSTNDCAATYTICGNELETHIDDDVHACNEKSGRSAKADDGREAFSPIHHDDKIENSTKGTSQFCATYTIQTDEELNSTERRKNEMTSGLDSPENDNEVYLLHTEPSQTVQDITKFASDETNSDNILQKSDVKSTSQHYKSDFPIETTNTTAGKNCNRMDHDECTSDSLRHTYTIGDNNESITNLWEGNFQGKSSHVENISIKKSQDVNTDEVEIGSSLNSRCLFSECINGEESLPVSAVPATPQSPKRNHLANNAPQAILEHQIADEREQHLANGERECSGKSSHASNENGIGHSTQDKYGEGKDDAKLKMPKRKTFSLEVESQELKEFAVSNQHNTVDLLNEICMEFENSRSKEYIVENLDEQLPNDDGNSNVSIMVEQLYSLERKCSKSESLNPRSQSQIEKSQDILKFSGKDSYEIPCGQTEHDSSKVSTNQMIVQKDNLCACSNLCSCELQNADLKVEEKSLQAKSLGNVEMHCNQFVHNDTPPASYADNSPELKPDSKIASGVAETIIIPISNIYDIDKSFKNEVILETSCPDCNCQIQLEGTSENLLLRFLGKAHSKYLEANNKRHAQDEACTISSAVEDRQLIEGKTNEDKIEKSSNYSESHSDIKMDGCKSNTGLIITSTYSIRESNPINYVADDECLRKESTNKPKVGLEEESEDLLAELTEMVPGSMFTESYEQLLHEEIKRKEEAVIEDEVDSKMEDNLNLLPTSPQKECKKDDISETNASEKLRSEDNCNNINSVNLLESMRKYNEESCYEMSEEIDPFLLRHNIPLNNSVEKQNIEKVLKEMPASSNDPDMMFAESLVAPLKSYHKNNKENQARNKSSINDLCSGNYKNSNLLENIVSRLPSPELDKARKRPLHPSKALNSQRQSTDTKGRTKRNSAAFKSPLSAKHPKKQFHRILTMENSDSDESTDETVKDSLPNTPEQQRPKRKTKSVQKLYLCEGNSSMDKNNRRDTRIFTGATRSPREAKTHETKNSGRRASCTPKSYIIDLSEVESNEELYHSEAQEKIRLEIEQMKEQIHQMEIQLQKTESLNPSLIQRRGKSYSYLTESDNSEGDSDDLFSPIPPTPPKSASKEEKHKSIMNCLR